MIIPNLNKYYNAVHANKIDEVAKLLPLLYSTELEHIFLPNYNSYRYISRNVQEVILKFAEENLTSDEINQAILKVLSCSKKLFFNGFNKFLKIIQKFVGILYEDSITQIIDNITPADISYCGPLSKFINIVYNNISKSHFDQLLDKEVNHIIQYAPREGEVRDGVFKKAIDFAIHTLSPYSLYKIFIQYYDDKVYSHKILKYVQEGLSSQDRERFIKKVIDWSHFPKLLEAAKQNPETLSVFIEGLKYKPDLYSIQCNILEASKEIPTFNVLIDHPYFKHSLRKSINFNPNHNPISTLVDNTHNAQNDTVLRNSYIKLLYNSTDSVAILMYANTINTPTIIFDLKSSEHIPATDIIKISSQSFCKHLGFDYINQKENTLNDCDLGTIVHEMAHRLILKALNNYRPYESVRNSIFSELYAPYVNNDEKIKYHDAIKQTLLNFANFMHKTDDAIIEYDNQPTYQIGKRLFKEFNANKNKYEASTRHALMSFLSFYAGGLGGYSSGQEDGEIFPRLFQVEASNWNTENITQMIAPLHDYYHLVFKSKIYEYLNKYNLHHSSQLFSELDYPDTTPFLGENAADIVEGYC